MSGEGFAFFRWRTSSHPYVGADASWWEFYRYLDFNIWRTRRDANQTSDNP